MSQPLGGTGKREAGEFRGRVEGVSESNEKEGGTGSAAGYYGSAGV